MTAPSLQYASQQPDAGTPDATQPAPVYAAPCAACGRPAALFVTWLAVHYCSDCVDVVGVIKVAA